MSNPPTGCPFNPRCAYAREICKIAAPELTAISPTHSSRCWLLDEDAPETNNPFKGGNES